MHEILDQLEDSDALGKRRGEDSRQQQTKYVSEVSQDTTVSRDGGEVVHGATLPV